MYQVWFNADRGDALFETYWSREEANRVVAFLKKHGNRAWVKVVHGDHNT